MSRRIKLNSYAFTWLKVVGYPVSVDKDGSGERRQAERAKRASIQVKQKNICLILPPKIFAKFGKKNMIEIQVTAREMRGLEVTNTSLELEEETETKEKKTEVEVAGASAVGEEGKGL